VNVKKKGTLGFLSVLLALIAYFAYAKWYRNRTYKPNSGK